MCYDTVVRWKKTVYVSLFWPEVRFTTRIQADPLSVQSELRRNAETEGHAAVFGLSAGETSNGHVEELRSNTWAEQSPAPTPPPFSGQNTP